jgi:menaquinone-dependent protoporphyrinogen IX oxidase
MRSLVIFHSRYGNTERIAHAVAEGLSERGEVRAVALREIRRADLESAQLVVLGMPTQFGGMPLSMRGFLRRSPKEAWFARPVTVFDTRFHQDLDKTGSAAVMLDERLRQMGALVVAPPESFFVTGMKGPLAEGEVERAMVWGRRLHLGDRVVLEGE